MDLQAHTMIGTHSPRWAKLLAFFCFAVACGLLVGSLTQTHRIGTAVLPSAPVSFIPIV